MGSARQLWLPAVSRPGTAMSEFHSHAIAASTAPAVHSVSAAAYLWIPLGIGAGLVVLLVLLTGLIGVPFVDEEQAQEVAQTAGLFAPRFWTARFYASAAWTFGDSGATNITALATALAAILASGTVLTSLFPTLDLNPFIIMNVACGGIVAAAPILFGIVNVVVMRGNPAVPIDARLTLQADATITLPSGASIALPGGAVVTKARDGPEKARIKPGGTISVPPGSKITVRSAALLALPSGATVAISAGATLTIDTPTQIPSANLAPPQVSQAGGHQSIWDWPSRTAVPDPNITASDLITVTEGAVVTVTGAADIKLGAATIIAPGSRGMAVKPGTTLTVPSATNVMAAGMGSVLSAAAVTIFGIGAEIGLIAVLAVHYSPAGHAGRVAAVVISAVVAAGLVLYGATGIRSLADPTPGTSLSSSARTSFTL
jgi:hypothetical protein